MLPGDTIRQHFYNFYFTAIAVGHFVFMLQGYLLCKFYLAANAR